MSYSSLVATVPAFAASLIPFLARFSMAGSRASRKLGSYPEGQPRDKNEGKLKVPGAVPEEIWKARLGMLSSLIQSPTMTSTGSSEALEIMSFTS